MGHSPSENYPLDQFDYKLLDTGAFQKLEQFGPHRFIRPAPQAIWPKSLSPDEWKKAEGEYKYLKGKETGGEWKFSTQLPKDGWKIQFRHLVFKIQPTGFGHIGIFPEQALNWLWIMDQLKQLNVTKIQVLNILKAKKQVENGSYSLIYLKMGGTFSFAISSSKFNLQGSAISGFSPNRPSTGYGS